MRSFILIGMLLLFSQFAAGDGIGTGGDGDQSYAKAFAVAALCDAFPGQGPGSGGSASRIPPLRAGIFSTGDPGVC